MVRWYDGKLNKRLYNDIAGKLFRITITTKYHKFKLMLHIKIYLGNRAMDRKYRIQQNKCTIGAALWLPRVTYLQ